VNREVTLSLPLIEEKAVRLNEAVKEETINRAKETGFREVSKDALMEFLESHSVIFMKEEPAGLDKRTYKEHRIFMTMVRV
jgi:hypothetical protein